MALVYPEADIAMRKQREHEIGKKSLNMGELGL